MSSVLDALRELEQEESPTAAAANEGAVVAASRRPRRRWLAIALACGSVGTLAYRATHERHPVSVASTRRASMTAPAPQFLTDVRPEDDARGAQALAPLPPRAERRAHARAAAPADGLAPEARVASTVAPPSPAAARRREAPAPSLRDATAGQAFVEASGEHGVRLQSLRYGNAPADRVAVVLVEGRTVSLHEGESAHGVGVQLILPDRVYLEQGGTVFAVGSR